jgi:hypothetical protein
MGYYPPYIPDTYLQAVKYIPNSSMSVKKVERVTKKHIDEHRLQHNIHTQLPQKEKERQGKGLFFDHYA